MNGGGARMAPRLVVSSRAREVPLRVTVAQPPANVEFRLQRGRAELVPATRVTATDIGFDFALRLGPMRQPNRPNLLGAVAQGPPSGRFVYINSGRRAGQAGSRWDRRAKVPLGGITLDLIQAALAAGDVVLEACFEGTGRDGGPACATVKLLGDGWRLVPRVSARHDAGRPRL